MYMDETFQDIKYPSVLSVTCYNVENPQIKRCYVSPWVKSLEMFSAIASVTNWGVCQGPISHNNEQTQSVEGII